MIYAIDNEKMKSFEFLLVYFKNKLDIQDCAGLTALHYAALIQNNKMLTMLLENGANPNVKDSNDETPLNSASEEGKKILLKYLNKSSQSSENKSSKPKTD